MTWRATQRPFVVTTDSPILDLAQEWDNAAVDFTALRLNVVPTAYAQGSKYFEIQSDGDPFFYVGDHWNDAGAMTPIIRFAMPDLSNTGALTLGGGVVQLMHKDLACLSYYWEGTPGGVAVLHGFGANRLSIESVGAITHIAANSRYEWEGSFSTETVDFIGYQKSSANGVPINITNTGQTPQLSIPLYVTNVHSAVESFAKFRDDTGSSPVDMIDMRSDGVIMASSLVLTNVPTSDPAIEGAVWNDGGVLMISAG